MSMWRKVGAVVIASVVLAGGAHAQSARTSPQQHEIQPLLDSMMVSANSHDTDRFLAPYLHDSTLVFVFNGVVTVGFDNVRALQLKWWNGGRSDVAYSQAGPSDFLVLAPDVVVVTSPLASRRTTTAGELQTGEFAVTMVWQKQRQGWRIVRVHESTVR
jgi:uncharacterized protein (TIGR02246 family)